VEPREDRKRKSTDRGLDDGSSYGQEIEEEHPVSPF